MEEFDKEELLSSYAEQLLDYTKLYYHFLPNMPLIAEYYGKEIERIKSRLTSIRIGI